jgi:hypothetical protein
MAWKGIPDPSNVVHNYRNLMPSWHVVAGQILMQFGLWSNEVAVIATGTGMPIRITASYNLKEVTSVFVAVDAQWQC